MNKKIYSFVCAVVVAMIMVSNPSKFGIITAGGGGWNLKEANQPDTVITNCNVSIAANQTSEQSLFQAVFAANYCKYRNGIFFGGDILFLGSTEFNFTPAVMDFKTGIVLPVGTFELKAGNFTRNSITTTGVDPQYGNYCIKMGESAAVSNAMQVSFIRKNTKVAIGHKGVTSFYSFDGNWYTYLEQNICKNVTISGGMDFGQQKTGFAAARWTNGTCEATITGNNLGTEAQNCLANFSYRNIPVWKEVLLTLTASFSAEKTSKGMHLTSGFQKGNLTLFGEVGAKVISNAFTPNCGVGVSFKL